MFENKRKFHGVVLITVLGSWPFRTWDISDHNRDFPVDGVIVHRN
jgi:hypothetical protein